MLLVMYKYKKFIDRTQFTGYMTKFLIGLHLCSLLLYRSKFHSLDI